MFKSICSVAAALIIAGIVALPGQSQVQARATAFNAKADRLDARPQDGACAQQEWPYYDAACLRDVRSAFGTVQPVRLVSTDGLPSAAATPAAAASRQAGVTGL